MHIVQDFFQCQLLKRFLKTEIRWQLSNTRFHHYLLFVMAWLVAMEGVAQTPCGKTVILTDSLQKKNLGGSETQGYVSMDTLSPTIAAYLFDRQQFKPLQQMANFENAPQSDKVYWMAICITNRSSYSDWYLELHDPHLGYAAVFEMDRGLVNHISNSGFYLPFQERMVQHKNHFFLFSVTPNTEKTLLVRLHTPTYAKFYVSIVKSNQMVNYSLKEYWYLGVYYGALTILLIYNFILFLSTRLRPFFWYTLFVTTCILNAFREDGLGFQFFWPAYPGFNYYHFDISKIFLLIAFTGFSCSFLDIRKKSPKLFLLLVVVVACYALSHVAESYFHHAWIINSYLYQIPFIIIFFAALGFAMAKDKPALHFLIGFTTFMVGVLCFFLRSKGLLPDNIYLIYAPNFSVLSEVAIMSYALASKYREQQKLLHITQQQEVKLLKENSDLDKQLITQLAEQDRLKESINVALEKKVSERTLELHAKNEELQVAYQQLSFYKERLETDWVKLDKEKWELSQQVNAHILDNIKGKAVSYETFATIFPTNDACAHYLSQLKWAQGFACKQCGHTKYSKGDLPYSRKCTRCTHRETATAGTLFHGVKIDLTKAFYITHLTLFGNGLGHLKDLAEQLQLRTATCWNFKKKVELAKQSVKGELAWENILLHEANP